VVVVAVAGVLVVVAGVPAAVEPELEFEFAVVELVLLVGLQPIKMAAKRTQKIKRDFFNIWFAPVRRDKPAGCIE
jgi:hypothetical protein